MFFHPEVTGSSKLYGSSCGFIVRAVSPHSSHGGERGDILLCFLTSVCATACTTRPCQDEHGPRCKEWMRNEQARVRIRQRYHISVGQPTRTSALSQHKIGDLGCYMQWSFFKTDFQLSKYIGIFYIICIIHNILKKVKRKLLVL